jgi:hypothetical protein
MADAAARAERCVAALDAAGRLISASSAEAAAQIGLLGSLTSDAAAHAERLRALGEAWRGPPPGAGALLDRLEAVGRRLEQTEAALPDRLQALIHQPAAQQAHAAAQAARDALAALTGLSAEFGAAASRLDAATSRHDGASAGLEAAIREVRTALEMVADKNRADASAAPPAATEPPDDVAATLARLAAVEQEAVRLLQQTEALANAVISGRAPELSPLLAARAPGLLAGLDTTMGRLRSAATAVALASDGPAWRGARQGGAG